MRFRTYKNTDLKVSEVGFGLWTVSTGWWGNFTEGEAIALMHKAFDLGITLFDAADTYGNGLSEELIAKAFPKQRDQITIATKVGITASRSGLRLAGFMKASIPFASATSRACSTSTTCSNNIPAAQCTTPLAMRAGTRCFSFELRIRPACWKANITPIQFFRPPIIAVIVRVVGCSTESRRSTSCVFSKIRNARLVKQRFNGCWPMIALRRRSQIS